MTPVLPCATTCFGAAGADDSDINKITWENSSRFLSWDPFFYTPEDGAAVRALRAKGADVDVSIRPRKEWARPYEQQRLAQRDAELAQLWPEPAISLTG
jgi:hypothetical protein